MEVSKQLFTNRIQYANNVSNLRSSDEITINTIASNEVSKCAAPKLTISNFRITKEIIFKECEFDTLILEDITSESQGWLKFENSTIFNIQITNKKPLQHGQQYNLTLNNIRSGFTFQIERVDNINRLDIFECNLTDLNIRHSRIEYISIVNILPPDELPHTLPSISFQNTTISAEAIISCSTKSLISDKLKGNCEFRITRSIHKCVKFFHSNLNSISAFACDQIDQFEISNSSCESVNLVDNKIIKLNLHPLELNSLIISSSDQIKNFWITYFEFNAVHVNSEIRVSNVVCKSFAISDLNNKKNFLLKNIRVLDSFSLDRSNLLAESSSTSELHNVNLLEAKTVSFYRSNLIGSNFYNIVWNSNYKLFKNLGSLKNQGNKYKIEHFQRIRESYRQLKLIAIENSNPIDAAQFQIGELDIYVDILSVTKKTWKQKADYAILLLSRNLGGYGVNILIPVKFWIIFHAILCLSIYGYGGFDYQFIGLEFSTFSLSNTIDASALFILLLNPLHSGDLLHGSNNIILLLDFFKKHLNIFPLLHY